jgi:elongation factor G
MAEEWHDKMVEAIAETDEDLTMKFLEGEAISNEELVAALRRATIACRMTPVLCGSSYKNKGVQMMLDAVVAYLPSPLDIPPIRGINPDTDAEEERPSDARRPFPLWPSKS